MEIILAVIVGFILGKFEKINWKKIHKYFASPVNEELELNWTLRQFFALFSNSMSQRWYEARAHCHESLFISILATLRIIYVVRFEYNTDDDSKIAFIIKYYNGFTPWNNLKEKLTTESEKYRTEREDALYLYQIFIPGYNIIFDYINGFLSYRSFI